jgi:hypothetical protein
MPKVRSGAEVGGDALIGGLMIRFENVNPSSTRKLCAKLINYISYLGLMRNAMRVKLDLGTGRLPEVAMRYRFPSLGIPQER